MRSQINIPLAVKLSPFFTALPNLATRLVSAGANGLVLFNRFIQPDLDIETLEVVPNLELEHLRRTAPAAALDRHPLRARSRPTWP